MVHSYLSEGQIIDGKWEILNPLGRGGMSTVYLVRDLTLNRICALKEVPIRGTRGGIERAKAVIAETDLLKTLNYPTIPRILDRTRTPNSLLIVMDYISGYSLRQVIAQKKYIPERSIVKWGITLCKTLRYLHNHQPKVIYRDMKPHNVMLTDEGELVLMDFGISRAVGENFDYSREERLGTKGYSAPEMALKVGHRFDERSDIFALGRTLYFLATGNSPTQTKTKDGREFPILPIREYDSTRSAGLEKIISKATAMRPDDRYQSVGEMLYDLEHIDELSEDHIALVEKRFRRVVGLFGTALLGTVLLGGGLVYGELARSDQFNQYLARGKTSQSVSDLLRAIELEPSNLAPYSELVKIYREQGQFTSEDELQLLGVLQPNLPSLRKQAGAGDMLYGVGQLYWFYYAQNGQIKSVPWFEEAKEAGVSSENRHLLTIYLELGTFKKNILSSITAQSDASLYSRYWSALSDLREEMGSDVQLHLLYIQSVYDVIDSYSGGLKSDGLGLEDLKGIFESAKSDLEGIAVSTDAQREQKAELESRSEVVLNKLNTTYGIR